MLRIALLIAAILAFVSFGCVKAYGDYDSPPSDPYGGGPPGGYGGGPGGPGGYGGGAPGGAPSNIKELTSAAEIKSFIEEDEKKAAIIGYFDLSTREDDKNEFVSIAEADYARDYRYAYVTEKNVLEESKYDGSAVIVHKPSKFLNVKYEKPKARYPSKTIKRETLQKFIHTNALTLVSVKSYDTTASYDHPKLPIVTVFADVDIAKNPKGYQYIANRVVKVAKDYKGKVIFNVADKDDYSYILEDYGIPKLEGKRDTAVGLVRDKTYYKQTASFSTDNLLAFVKDFLDGKLAGIEKEDAPTPEPTPPSHDEGEDDDSNSSVVTLTTDNFKTEVEESGADVMLEFYAPWCGHCKHLKPEYKQLAQAFEGDSGVKIAAMDATAHTVPGGYDVQGYPTLYFLPAGAKKPVAYDGEREASAMEAYIRKNRVTTA